MRKLRTFVGCVAWLVLGTVGVFALPARAADAGEIRLSGAGATLPAPLYSKWVVEYQKTNPDVKIDYRSIGSGGGIKAITDKTVAFGASDAPLNAKEIEAMGGASKIVQIPATTGGVVATYNLPGVTQRLKFTGEVLADIYLGVISAWNDPKLAALNPDVKLPATTITPTYRTDGSGTTFVFTSYLGTQSERFTKGIGAGKQVKWPVGQGGKGNEGVAAAVQQTPGAIGYVELNYATANKLAYGSLKNAGGAFITPSPESISIAGEGAADALSGTVLAANIWNQSREQAYPIATFSYIIVYADLSNLASMDEAKALVGFLHWASTTGQQHATELDYGPIGSSVQAKVAEALSKVTFKGQAIADTK